MTQSIGGRLPTFTSSTALSTQPHRSRWRQSRRVKSAGQKIPPAGAAKNRSSSSITSRRRPGARTKNDYRTGFVDFHLWLSNCRGCVRALYSASGRSPFPLSTNRKGQSPRDVRKGPLTRRAEPVQLQQSGTAGSLGRETRTSYKRSRREQIARLMRKLAPGGVLRYVRTGPGKPAPCDPREADRGAAADRGVRPISVNLRKKHIVAVCGWAPPTARQFRPNRQTFQPSCEAAE